MAGRNQSAGAGTFEEDAEKIAYNFRIANEATFTSADGYSGYTSTLSLIPRYRLWRVTDEVGTLERRYSFAGGRLRLGQTEFRRQTFHQPTDPGEPSSR